MERLNQQEAEKFFAELYYGAHHILGYEVIPFGHGFCVKDDRTDMATTDFNRLTRFVLMCHRDCYRGELIPINKNTLKVAIWKRTREGGISESHPTIEQAIEGFKNSKHKF